MVQRVNDETKILEKIKNAQKGLKSYKDVAIFVAWVGLTRPAPAELPQDRKVARVGGCSGAM